MMVKVFSFSFPYFFPSSSSHPTAVPLVVFHFFPVAGLNENKLDERIDMNQQNLNIKTSNHKIEKTKISI